MRWLLICLFVSLGALLLTAAGVARHIWRHRQGAARPAPGSPLSINSRAAKGRTAADETDAEPEL
jgi:hypothetical protein